MTSSRRIGIALAAIVALLIAAGIARSAWRRAQEPQYEGRTASEWLHYLAAYSWQGSIRDELARKEGEIAFRSMGEPGQRFLIRFQLSAKKPSRVQTNLYALGEKLPAAIRPRFLRSRAAEFSASRELLRMIRPPWDTFQPEVMDAFHAGSNRTFTATLLMGYAGRGGTNAVPLLVSSPSNAPPNFRILALQSLHYLGTNAAPALPTLISWTEQWTPGTRVTSVDGRILDIITANGSVPAVAPVVSKLEEMLAVATQPKEQRELASALLRIDPAHTAAFAVLEAQLHPGTNQAKHTPRNVLANLWPQGPPNPAFARLASKLIEASAGSRDEWYVAVQVLLRNDPPAGVAAIHRKLADDRFDSTAVGALYWVLQHDPRDAVALSFLERQATNEFFPRDANRFVIVGSYQNCLPNSPGVLELLKSIQPAPDDEALRNAIRETLRHIELNGKLKALRERDAAAGR
jgi:hypothetical protein